MHHRAFLLLFLAFLLCIPMCAPDARAAEERRVASAVRAAKPPVIDGDLADEAWAAAPEIRGFVQREPEDGKPATQETVVKVVYDDDAIYVSAFLHDTNPVRTLLGRRDIEHESDWFRVYFDPQNDDLTGASFWVNPSNVQADIALYNDIYNDWSWDGVWSSQAKVVPGGWTAEMRIPYSQLRFGAKDVHVWGVNFVRRIASNKEIDRFVNVPKGQTGWVSRFADLTGIAGVKHSRSFELVPYGVARTDLASRVDVADPFAQSSQQRMDAGLDVKYGLTSSLTLTGTINPDFGQVEVDPAVVNLSQFETFFPEKRPFFTEGASIFTFGSGPARSRWNFNLFGPSLFYSRRIGRSPQGTGNLAVDYVDAPGETTILGAAKITGRVGGKWTIGVLDALTDRETADHGTFVDLEDGTSVLQRGREQVEPMTNYLVARTTREYGKNSRIGMMVTSVNRRVPSELSYLRGNAYAAGIDGYTFFRKKDWLLEWQTAMTRVTGSASAIESTQNSAARYFGRPDATHVELDPTRTSLDGFGGRIMLARQTGKWMPNIQIQTYSPGYETNDVGFMPRTDVTATHAVVHYLDQDVRRFTREISVWAGKFQNWNHDKDLLANGFMVDAFIDLKNYWYTFGWGLVQAPTWDDRETRGGPLTRRPGSDEYGLGIGTDSRKKLFYELWGSRWSAKDGSYSSSAAFTVKYRPTTALLLSVAPQFTRAYTNTQYVTTIEDSEATATYGNRYVFAELDQRTVDIGTRVEWTVSSRLSFQLFLQPFLATGGYHGFQQLARPRSGQFVPLATEPAENDEYRIAAASDIRFSNPDFNLRSVRGSAVVRWEFRPGSALYVVWNENRAETLTRGDFRFRRDFAAIPDAPSEDVFLVKVSYWLPM